MSQPRFDPRRRNGLRKWNGKRLRFSATVERFGEKQAFRGPPVPTILLVDVRIRETGERITDHLWFTRGKFWAACKPGCRVVFDARVSEYEKGYKGRREDVYDCPVRTDFRLERPSKLETEEETVLCAITTM